jgi:hypothetical protein
VEILIDSLRAFPDHIAVQAEGASALCRLSLTVEHRVRILNFEFVPELAHAMGTFAKGNLAEDGQDWHALATLFDAKGMADARRDGTMNQPRTGGADQLRGILKDIETQLMKKALDGEPPKQPKPQDQKAPDDVDVGGRFGNLLDRKNSKEGEEEDEEEEEGLQNINILG